MSSAAEHHDRLVLFEQGGARVARVAQRALADDSWPQVRGRLLQLVDESPQGLIVDCRDLPSGADQQLGPLLYELTVAARRHSPPVALCAVGEADQSTGDSKTFLVPPRCDTIEAAGQMLDVRRSGIVPVRFPTGQSSQTALPAPPPAYPWLQSMPLQVIATIVVLTFTISLVTYSAMASFAAPVVPRRRSTQLVSPVAIEGRVLLAAPQGAAPDPTAVVIAWPAYAPPAKYTLTAADVFAAGRPVSHAPVLIVRVAPDGSYSMDRTDLVGASVDYWLLALSQQASRQTPPPEADLKSLDAYLQDPAALLGLRTYELHRQATSSDRAAVWNCTLPNPAPPVASAAAARAESSPPAASGSGSERAP